MVIIQRKCDSCRKISSNDGQSYELCPECVAELNVAASARGKE